MDDPRSEVDEAAPRAADGRVAGRRGRATRQRLLDSTRQLLGEGSYRDLKVVDISRRANTSPATFYQYFPDVETAVLALTDELAELGGHQLRALITEPAWDSSAAARALADGFLEFFAEHGDLVRVVDLAALEGDERFRQLRVRLFNGVYLALHDLVHESRAAGQSPGSMSPGAVASVLTTMLAHVSAHRPGFETWGVFADDLAEAMTAVIDWSIRGEVPPDSQLPRSE